MLAARGVVEVTDGESDLDMLFREDIAYHRPV